MSLTLIAKEDPKAINSLYRYKHHVFKDGKLGLKEKEILATIISCVDRCEVCVRVHAEEARKAGATKEEFLEALEVAMYLCGPSVAIWSTVVDEIISD